MLKSAVVDTSVLVSAFLFPESISGRVVLPDVGIADGRGEEFEKALGCNFSHLVA
jgi:hypothetical protein